MYLHSKFLPIAFVVTTFGTFSTFWAQVPEITAYTITSNIQPKVHAVFVALKLKV